MSPPAAPSLAWVPGFVDSTNRALDGDVVDALLEQRVDPLQWVLTLTSSRPWDAASAGFTRGLLRGWCDSNDAVLGSTGIGRNTRTWSALIIVKGLGPEKNTNPYEEEADGTRHRGGRLHQRPAVRR